ncbi:hypothetical protein OL548_28905 [Lysinibacillus sp. MHQ-1]|nr:hypothetical protein OL548_28905 [Lysinibacillus sp. MHQ-1]
MNGDVKMTGNMTTYITKVNKACDDLDFVSARVLIETNLVKLSEAKKLSFIKYQCACAY